MTANDPTQREELVHDLVTRHGTIYGLEEARAILDCLSEDAPTKGPRLLAFERASATSASRHWSW